MEYLGIDVAKWQGVIDWAKVKKAGVKLANGELWDEAAALFEGGAL